MIFSAEVMHAFPHKIVVYMHVKEYGRLSNTGALVQVAFPPPQTRVFIADLPEHEVLFQQELVKDPVSEQPFGSPSLFLFLLHQPPASLTFCLISFTPSLPHYFLVEASTQIASAFSLRTPCPILLAIRAYLSNPIQEQTAQEGSQAVQREQGRERQRDWRKF